MLCTLAGCVWECQKLFQILKSSHPSFSAQVPSVLAGRAVLFRGERKAQQISWRFPGMCHWSWSWALCSWHFRHLLWGASTKFLKLLNGVQRGFAAPGTLSSSNEKWNSSSFAFGTALCRSLNSPCSLSTWVTFLQGAPSELAQRSLGSHSRWGTGLRRNLWFCWK